MEWYEKHDAEVIKTKQHSVVGITSFICSVVFLILWIVVVAVTCLYGANPNVSAGHRQLLGVLYLGMSGLFIIPLFLGIISLFEKGINKLFPGVGVLISIFALAISVSLIIIGNGK